MGSTHNSGIQNLTPWPKGVSGNPGGRPKSKPISEAYKRIGEMTPKQYAKFRPSTIFERRALQMFKSRGPDFIPAQREITNRVEGSVETDSGQSSGNTLNLFIGSWKPTKELNE